VAVLSIRKYLDLYGTTSTNETNVLLHVCTQLLEGIARHAVAFDREEYGQFSATLHKLASTLPAVADADQLLAVADVANETMESYNREAQRVYAAQTVELRCMIEMVSQTLVALAEAGGQSVQNLQTIRTQVERARQLDDIRLVRARLGDSLKCLSDEARLQRERNAEILQHAQEAALVASGNGESADVDRISGLPSSEKAERQVAKRVGAESPYYAAVFVVERVESINLRYGYSAGDQLLQAFGKYLASNLSPKDELFRWRGPAFVMLLDRACPADGVRMEVGRFTANRKEDVVDVNGKPLTLPLSCAWTVVQLSKCETGREACQQIERFVAEHGDKRAE